MSAAEGWNEMRMWLSYFASSIYEDITKPLTS